ncbi:hypothetical protein Q5P01_021719 [Channa striata]|uniref:Uncharacterized protein n=1 Tax=Channa striata TaxID=64152 RepID=A0AA88S9N2_CHASR|nr:hypothetical protein Q5P01_021719 [Channa striata]
MRPSGRTQHIRSSESDEEDPVGRCAKHSSRVRNWVFVLSTSVSARTDQYLLQTTGDPWRDVQKDPIADLEDSRPFLHFFPTLYGDELVARSAVTV